MKLVFIYGPDGSGKTTIARELQFKFKESIVIPFEPSKFGGIVKEIDSGYGGQNSAVKKSINFFKSLVLFLRYILRFVFFYLRFSKKFKYVFITRGPIEFGINDTHKKFPKFFGATLQSILSKNNFLIIRPVDLILKQKPELPRMRILELYEEYSLSGCKPILNISKEECVNQISNIIS
jgi:hypothetical protein